VTAAAVGGRWDPDNRVETGKRTGKKLSELVWFRAYVEQLLKEMWGQQDLITDADGDYPSRYGNAAIWVRIEGGAPMAVRVFAHAAYGVKRTAKLLAELNEVTTRSRFGSVHWVNGAVVSEYSLPAGAVDAETLAGMFAMVGDRADEIGLMVATVFGGQTPFDPDVVNETQPGGGAA
jgi:hypothetical protein